ncbi:MAG TPA: hypothetical protein VGT24_00540 [Candidatus Acidoferrales bacterium]|nr:hypothetical protein [Candidatus Acidoferrales bacterium]
MRTRFLGSILPALMALACATSVYPQTPAKPWPATAKAAPDLSGIWEPHRPVAVTADTALCGIRTVCDQLRGTTTPLMEARPDEPEMQPGAVDKYKAVRQGRGPTDFGRQSLDPNFTGCLPEGPTDMMVDNRRIFELRQFPDEVLLLFDEDHWVRRIYMDGRGHPDGYATTWMGHSIGRYEGDSLIVDTIGINDTTWIDRLGHPHSNSLHLVERLRRVSQNSLEYEYTIDDPKVYKKPWTAKMMEDLLPPDFQILEGVSCEELLEKGTHYSDKSRK